MVDPTIYIRYQKPFKLRFEDIEARRVANFSILRTVNFRSLIKNREFFKISSRKWNIIGIGSPGVILVNSMSNNR